MDFAHRKDLTERHLPGRIIQNAVGKEDQINSKKMTVCFAHYSDESGPMEPHNHAEETVIVLSSDRAFVKYGSDCKSLENTQYLEVGDVMHFAELEWHVFRHESGGHLDAICIYGQVDNIRPEDIKKDKEKLK